MAQVWKVENCNDNAALSCYLVHLSRTFGTGLAFGNTGVPREDTLHGKHLSPFLLLAFGYLLAEGKVVYEEYTNCAHVSILL
eukprot:3767935-Amphidinium_carterae.2